ncbi:unnamed protein product [Adineta ricciae]|uniref:HAT C-terminal dimerisation domain-containing protein n=1 Tax=Adineta ricciae TaxID=249248 RepID=A0A816CZH8_ADIRI|nr:unnamed protein product [Adineta ricciae]CAF1630565.1 unnamed protein product [Adineta ricciae]
MQQQRLGGITSFEFKTITITFYHVCNVSNIYQFYLTIGTNPSGSKSPDIITMMNKQKHVPFETKRLFVDAYATFCSYDLRSYEIVNERRGELIETLLSDLNVVKLFGISTDYWKNKCELQNKLPLTLKKDICTRWNSTYHTLWPIWLSFDEVKQILDTRNEIAHLEKIDRYLVKDIIDLLGIFKIGSEKLSADHVPTLYSVLSWLHKLKKTCELKDTDRLHIRQLKQKILDKLDNKIWLTDIHYIANFLHLETKSLSTLSQLERNVLEKKRNKRAKRDDISVHGVLKEFVSNSADDEVVEYMKLKINYPEGEGILVSWKKHSAIFPQLSRLALSLLSIPASSAASERAFSETGRILEARRQQLHPESLDSLVCFLRNFR